MESNEVTLQLSILWTLYVPDYGLLNRNLNKRNNAPGQAFLCSYVNIIFVCLFMCCRKTFVCNSKSIANAVRFTRLNVSPHIISFRTIHVTRFGWNNHRVRSLTKTVRRHCGVGRWVTKCCGTAKTVGGGVRKSPRRAKDVPTGTKRSVGNVQIIIARAAGDWCVRSACGGCNIELF